MTPRLIVARDPDDGVVARFDSAPQDDAADRDAHTVELALDLARAGPAEEDEKARHALAIRSASGQRAAAGPAAARAWR
ncbi:MAG: hypothetical protein AAB114_01530, partial [Chloroflexota bacterium]